MATYNQPLPTGDIWGGTAVPLQYIAVIIDASHSAWLALAQLVAGVQGLYGSLADCPEAEVCALYLRDDRVHLAEDFVPASASRMPQMVQTLRPKGHSPLGDALRSALARIDAKVRVGGPYAAVPEIVLISDGEATDDVGAVIPEIRARVDAGHLRVRALAYGSPALGVLRALADDQVTVVSRLADLPDAMARCGDHMAIRREHEVADAYARGAGPEADLSDVYVGLDFANAASWGCPKGHADISTPLAVMKALKAHRVRYTAWVDASFIPWYGKHIDRTGADYLHVLAERRPDCFQVAPAGGPADPFILDDVGSAPKGAVITRDLYREWLRDYPANYGWFREPGRRITGARARDFVFLHPIRWRVAVGSNNVK